MMWLELLLFVGSILSAVLVLFLLAILQGAWNIRRFQRRFVGAAFPPTPSHGVVFDTSSVSWDDPPIRILVLGDSLAGGMGQCQSPSPVLPAAVAEVLAKDSRKVVEWTCLSRPGASTARLAREWEKQGTDCLKRNGRFVEDEELRSMSSNETEAGWAEQIRAHRQQFYQAPGSLDRYDIIIVAMGGNDLKMAFFPFLSTEDHSEAGVSGFYGHLAKLVTLLIPRIDDTCRNTCGEFSLGSPAGPLVVLAGLPISGQPATRHYPYRSFALAAFDWLDSCRQQLAEQFPGQVKFVRAPLDRELIDHHSPQQRSFSIPRTDSMVRFTTLTPEEGLQRVKAMQEWYGRDLPDCRRSSPCFATREVGRLLFSADNFHPNELGKPVLTLSL